MNGHQLALDGAIIHRGYLFAFEISNMARASHSISIEAATGIVSSVYIRRESIFNALCVHIIYECKCEEEAPLCEAGTLKQNVPRLSDDPLKILPPPSRQRRTGRIWQPERNCSNFFRRVCPTDVAPMKVSRERVEGGGIL